ncbi:MAG: IS1595 family transposase [Gammaproteobacteria bacterium]|nr:MAG: IS1595 family transposase [Gammaproteobacteria bacterium]
MDKTPQTLLEVIRYFSDPAVCLDFMVRLRWPNGVACPTCGSMDVRFLDREQRWECKARHPRKKFSVKVGTIFEDSPIGLDKWFAAEWLIANAKNGISSMEMSRSLGVTQKTAWFMLARIRLAMQTGTFEKFTGHVEADETFIGGAARFMHEGVRERKIKGTGGVGSGKAVVMGLLERHGEGSSQVRVKHVRDNRKSTVQNQIRDHVAEGSAVFTDALKSYDGLADQYAHDVIDHAEAYARGNVHTNGLENFWSLSKRSIKGTYVSVEPFHLFRYLDEQAFRFNNRYTGDAERFEKVAGRVIGKRLTYAALTGKGELQAAI